MMQKNIIEKIKKSKWHADWSNATPLPDVSFEPAIYFYGLSRNFGKSFSKVLVIYNKGIAQGFLPEQEYRNLGEHLAGRLTTAKAARVWANKFVMLADKMLFLASLDPADFLRKWETSERLYGDFGAFNEATKTVFDVRNKKLPEKIKNILFAARKHSENFYPQNAQLYLKAVSQLEKPKLFRNDDLLMMTRQELIEFMKKKKLPSIKTLKNRRECCGIYFTRSGMTFLNKKEIKEIESYWKESVAKKISGNIAFKGKAIGKCRVIRDFKGAYLNAGDILVTGMTDPNFLPLMKKSGAIVTDGGGMLSHAAIVARELKKPCIIGTKIATKILKDGDLVEVDADKGVVKILK